jgi:hypothetical protein
MSDHTNDSNFFPARKTDDSTPTRGTGLDVHIDFKVWGGIVYAFSTYVLNNNRITLKFPDFAGMCGYEPDSLSSDIRVKFKESLRRIQSQKINLQTNTDKKGSSTVLLLKTEYDTETDIITIFADEKKKTALYSSIKSSPQPNVLIRTALFAPQSKKPNSFEQRDVTTEFKNIEYFSSEGYDSASIIGPRLNIQIDFKVWCGIVFAFSKYGLNNNKITLKFTEFAKYCGYKPARYNKYLRLQIENSLDRIQSQKIRFKTKDAKKSVATGLLFKGEYDTEKDVIVLLADENLWEIFTLDHQVLISLEVLSKLPQSEVAQCLYLYFASFPQNPYPITYERMQKRIQLNMPSKEANRSIRNAIKKLEGLGYLKGEWVEFHDEKAYKITSRNKSITI